MNFTEKTVVVTGSAGFIGFHLSRRLLREGFQVVGVDNINSYYDPKLKRDRLDRLVSSRFLFLKGDIADSRFVNHVWREHRPAMVVNLAAQAGVRYSLVNSSAYVQSNLLGFANILEACRTYPVKHLLYASSSSVYGGNKKVPFDETDRVDHPVSLYAATKKSNELMAECYAHLYGIPTTGLRFFTVYGPFGRPDMAYYSFTDKYFAGEPIQIFNNGDLQNDLSRDFTYVDDVVESLVRLLPIAPADSPSHRILNIGGSRPEKLMNFIRILETELGAALGQTVEFKKVFEPQKPGDVPTTFASARRLENLTGFMPQITLREGLRRFTRWYVSYANHGTQPDVSLGYAPPTLDVDSSPAVDS